MCLLYQLLVGVSFAILFVLLELDFGYTLLLPSYLRCHVHYHLYSLTHPLYPFEGSETLLLLVTWLPLLVTLVFSLVYLFSVCLFPLILRLRPLLRFHSVRVGEYPPSLYCSYYYIRIYLRHTTPIGKVATNYLLFTSPCGFGISISSSKQFLSFGIQRVEGINESDQ
ncbi:hypothetical protein BDN72DRAFT_265918 [Pluteus cervinus]|uniref:Uncharacterized protein n=1 Tax=Pluteus cervinus TaxID=181527 RepID=A0ACD3AHQ8_9AGAR|nr:hypothetical protein BDN72DRAFT_265918 [Pluteus cervinus]